MSTNQLEPAYLLHARPYRNTSILANFFTQNHGRVDAVVRGARGQNSKIRGLLQPFTPIVINWYGHGELVTIKTVESNRYLAQLTSDSMLCGIYVNELLSRLIRGRDAHGELYQAYEELLLQLSTNISHESVLRLFEKKLLETLGYGLQLEYELDTGSQVVDELWYQYIYDRGPVKITQADINHEKAFLGKNLLAIAKDDFSSKDVLRDAKRLMRYALRELLGEKPLNSREFFIS